MKTLVLWMASRVLYLASKAIGERTSIPPEHRARVYRTPWCLKRHPKMPWSSQYTLYVTDENRDCLMQDARLSRLVYCGRVVFGVEFSPDGPGTLYVFDARQQQPDVP
jgi:hypothetical protein